MNIDRKSFKSKSEKKAKPKKKDDSKNFCKRQKEGKKNKNRTAEDQKRAAKEKSPNRKMIPIEHG